MATLTAVLPYRPAATFIDTLTLLSKSEHVDSLIVLSGEAVEFTMPRCRVLVAGPLVSGKTLITILEKVGTEHLLILLGTEQITIGPEGLERLLATAESTDSGIVYADYYQETQHGKRLHPLNDYQAGSVRDDFDFGPMILFSVGAARNALKKYGPIPSVQYAGLYDLRLKISIDHRIHHLAEPLYTVTATAQSLRSETLFAYVDPVNQAVQEEMETVFTDYLKNIGAFIPSHRLHEANEIRKSFPRDVSVIIPVRNRKETIVDAVQSALSQKTDFSFNVIVVDNHSTDGTTVVLSELAMQHPVLKHVVPKRTDLGIGGCWNEAIHSATCGRYAVQLDSDDLYSSPYSLQKLINMFRQGNYAMVIGSYTIVNFGLEEIPPGIIDHREWTDENGHNNALRINGLGAPRAFNTVVIREIGFLNVGYGEDYAAALQISRTYRIGRIYESLYLCRRWPGNTDAALSIEEENRNNAFKDRVRTEEILARQEMNRQVTDQGAN